MTVALVGAFVLWQVQHCARQEGSSVSFALTSEEAVPDPRSRVGSID